MSLLFSVAGGPAAAAAVVEAAGHSSVAAVHRLTEAIENLDVRIRDLECVGMVDWGSSACSAVPGLVVGRNRRRPLMLLLKWLPLPLPLHVVGVVASEYILLVLH